MYGNVENPRIIVLDFSRHMKVQLRIHRAWIAEFFGFILGLPVKVLDGFQIKWYEMKAGTFNLPGAWFGTRAMMICSWISARRWTGPTVIFPPLSLYYYTRVNVQRRTLSIVKITVFNLKNFLHELNDDKQSVNLRKLSTCQHKWIYHILQNNSLPFKVENRKPSL